MKPGSSPIAESTWYESLFPKDMPLSQVFLHKLTHHLYCGVETFDLVKALETWNKEEFQKFLNVVCEYKEDFEFEKKNPELFLDRPDL